MIFFILGILALIVAYFVYGTFVERIFGISDAPTPAITQHDGVDFVPISTKKAVLIQFLNIAGTGPIFGAIAGAMWGLWAYLWIILGSIFAGTVHDYFSGMLSVRNKGGSISEVVGKYLGHFPLVVMRIFSVVLLLLVGVVFMMTPAQVLQTLFNGGQTFFYIALAGIVLYYLISTVMPIDKIIAKIYPFFGAVLIFMAIGVTIMLFVNGDMRNMPVASLSNVHPSGTMIFPFLFITIACGAISGFHATQSPMMARCLKTEKDGRKVFYGSMIIEAVIAMIWATAAMTHFGSIQGLAGAGAAPVVVTTVSTNLLGIFGGALAVIGVVAAPITSGDTAFRSARLTIADAMKLEQAPKKNRYLIAIPLFAVGVILTQVNFDIIWRYFAWSNQTLATIALWAFSVYLMQHKKNYWITYLPAIFMTAVVTSFIIIAPIGFGLPYNVGLIAGIGLAAFLAVFFQIKARKKTETLS